MGEEVIMTPIRFDLKEESLDAFKARVGAREVIDTYREQIEDVFLVRNPRYKFDKNYGPAFEEFLEEHAGGKPLGEMGNWFFFSWSGKLVHYLPEELHQEIRTARNKNIITGKEQQKFYNFRIGIAGLSVGSHAAATLAMMGGGRVLKLADPDAISASNLNRIRYDYTQVGMNKCELAAQYVYQLNPYAEIRLFPKGVSVENIQEFLKDIDILVEETDNLELKIRLRLEARKLGIPVVMATDNGDNVIVDIERYDLNKDLKLFNGAAGDLTLEEFQKFPPQELPKLATKIAGPELVVPRMLGSLLEVGKTLYSWPQLGDAATLSGVAVAYVVRKLALGEPVRSGKIDVNLGAMFEPDYASREAGEQRVAERQKFLRRMGL